MLILGAGVLLVLLVWGLDPGSRFKQGETHLAAGRPMGEYSLTPLIGATETASSESLSGDVVLINFWGTWCPPCLMEFPHLVELNDRLKSDERFHFIPVVSGPGGVDADEEQLRTTTEAYLAKLDAELDVYTDPGAVFRRSLMQSAEMQGFSFPTTILLDGDNMIRGLWVGYGPDIVEDMEAAIKSLLK